MNPTEKTVCPYCRGKKEVVVKAATPGGTDLVAKCPRCRGTGEAPRITTK